MDLNELIHSVMNKPPLWDRKDPAYNNKEIKYMLWKDVCRELQWGIGDLEMKAKWTSLRDIFRREFQKELSGCKKKTKWAYYDQMMFLKPSILHQAQKNNRGKIGKIIVPRNFVEEPVHPEIIINDSEENRQGEEIIIESEENGQREEEESNEVEMSQPDENQIDTPCNTMGRGSISKENDYDEDDYHFAMSLVPAMKRVPNDRKLRMRMKILQILSEEGGANDSSG